MAGWSFIKVPASAVRMEVTQADQFNNDEVSLAEALVRESIQNSSDAPVTPNGMVKVRFAVREVTGAPAQRLSKQLAALRPHYAQCKIDAQAIDAQSLRVLTIEDFNTKGLTGSVVDIDRGNFDSFWRGVGDSGKVGKAGGRWGLGKLVYSSASALKFFYGLTVTEENPKPSFLGQVVLKNHRIGNDSHPAHGFYFDGVAQPLDLQQPVSSDAEISALKELGGVVRTNQTGLSLVIPHLLDGITEESIISGVITNYYFPILAGKLVVEVGDVVIDKNSFLTVAANHKSVHPIPFSFVKSISDSLGSTPPVVASASLGKGELNASFFTPEQIASMKEQYAKGEMVRARIPVELKPKAGGVETSFVDLYLKALPENEKPYCLVARNAITLPGERRYFGGAAYAALIANDEQVSSFLGDAENPAHTAWNSQAKKLNERWRTPGPALSSVRHSLRHFHSLIAEQAETEDNDALLDFFSILDQGQGKKDKKPKPPVPPIPPIPPREKAISIRPRKGGFDIVPGPAAEKWTYPRTIRVRIAYDMIGANPFNRHSPFDFDLSKKEIDIAATSATYEPLKPNVLKVVAQSKDFKLEFNGFDQRRDVVVDARAQ